MSSLQRAAGATYFFRKMRGTTAGCGSGASSARVPGPLLWATLDGESSTRLPATVAAYYGEVDHLWPGRALAA